jgi:uncharacterized protein
MGALRDVILFRHFHLMYGVLALLAAAWLANLAFGQFNPGFEGQPVAHTQWYWNFAGMTVAGLAFALAGGCPGRQLFLAGEGDGDAAIFVLGMIVGRCRGPQLQSGQLSCRALGTPRHGRGHHRVGRMPVHRVH